jgi:Ala-tRNA(Pro) deacylase
MDGRDRLESYFRENGVAFDVQEHRTAFTAQRIAATEHIPGRMFAKVALVKADGDLVMLVLPAPSVVDLAKVSEVLGGKEVRMASESEFAPAFGDCEPGAMPPFGQLYGMSAFLDTSLADEPEFVFEAGTHREEIRMPMGEYLRVEEPAIASVSARRAA